MNLYLHNLRILGRYASGIFRFFSAPTKKIGHAHGKAQTPQPRPARCAHGHCRRADGHQQIKITRDQRLSESFHLSSERWPRVFIFQKKQHIYKSCEIVNPSPLVLPSAALEGHHFSQSLSTSSIFSRSCSSSVTNAGMKLSRMSRSNSSMLSPS